MSALTAARASAACGGRLRVRVRSESGTRTRIINPPDRPTYLGKKSVRTSEATRKDNTWKDEKLFVSNPVSLRYVAGEQIVLVDEKFPFRITTQDETKLAFVQVDDDESAYNQNTYLLDLKSMKAAYSRLRIYRGSLPGIMAGQFSLDCKVSYRR